MDQQGAWSGPLLQRLDARGWDARDLALANELTLGVLRRKIALDAVIAAFSSRPLERVNADVRVALWLGLYQVLFLERIPPHAAVNETVNLVRALPHAAHAASFVNALLRAALKDVPRARAVARGAGEADPVQALGVAESHPAWLARRWVERFGLEGARALMEAQNHPAPVSARVMGGAPRVAEALRELEQESIAASVSPVLEDFIRIQGPAQHSALFRSGGLYIQDEASALAARLAGVKEGDLVLDACAAPGGKTFIMAALADEGGLVVACDRSSRRLEVLQENAVRLRVSCAALAADLAEGNPFRDGTRFDVVAVDAPCSGTGVIRRHPELRYRAGDEALSRLVPLQAGLLSTAAVLVKPGGTLVYSVCSLEPEEGERQIDAFLDRQPGFVLEDPSADVLLTRPDRDGLDGFFAARLRRQRA